MVTTVVLNGRDCHHKHNHEQNEEKVVDEADHSEELLRKKVERQKNVEQD